MTRSQRIVVTSGGWAVFVLATLLVLNLLSLEVYFMLCLLGFIVIAQMSGPFISRPQWRSRVNLAIVAGIVAFVLLVVGKVLGMLQIRLF